MTALVAEREAYREDFAEFRSGRREPPWLAELREAAYQRFAERGYPTTREEAWRFTSVAPIARTRFARPAPGTRLGSSEALRLSLGGAVPGPRAVFVNGRFAPELSALDGAATVTSLADAIAADAQPLAPLLGRVAAPAGAFADLNAAFAEDGALVRIPAGRRLEAPLHLLYVSVPPGDGAPTVSHPRTLVVAGRGSEATLVEKFGGPDGRAYFTNAVTEVVLEDGAGLAHYRIQREGRAAFHVATLAVRQGRDSRYAGLRVALGAALARADVAVRLLGEGAECRLDGLFLADGEQHTDSHTAIDHAVPRTASRELYKGVVGDRARGVFHGTVLVRPGAQKTDAHQANYNLLLSREALVHSTPALEIRADDVKCKHGSTTGQLDATALFYLRSRGIGEAAARGLLTFAFASELVSRIRVPALRFAVLALLEARLPGVPVEAVA
jgi:Fe-S cluster assembly protein SufD